MTPFRKKLLMETGIGLLVALPLFGGIAFFSAQVGRFGDEIATARRDLFNRTAELDTLASLRAEYNDNTKRYLDALQALVPVKDQLINLSRDFQTMAAQSKLTSTFTFVGETPPANGALGYITFRLNLHGDLNDLFSFIGRFEKFRYLSVLSNFTMTRGDTASDMLSQGNVYYRSP